MHHYVDGFMIRRRVKGLLGLFMACRDHAYEHVILELGILELQREAILQIPKDLPYGWPMDTLVGQAVYP